MSTGVHAYGPGMWRVLVLLAFGACGRLELDEQDDAAGDATACVAEQAALGSWGEPAAILATQTAASADDEGSAVRTSGPRHVRTGRRPGRRRSSSSTS